MYSIKKLSFTYLFFVSILISSVLIGFFGIKDYFLLKETVRSNALNYSTSKLSEVVNIYEEEGAVGNKILITSRLQNIMSQNPDLRNINLYSSNGYLLLGNNDDFAFSTVASQKPYVLDGKGKFYFDNFGTAIQSPFKVIVPDSAGSFVSVFTYDDSRLYKMYFQLALVLLFLTLFSLYIGSKLSGRLSSKLAKPIEILSAKIREYGKTAVKQDFKDISTTSTEIAVLAHNFDKMQDDLEIAHKEHIEKEKLDYDVSLAGRIQQRLLPKSAVDIDFADVKGVLVPAYKVGGDMFDILKISKNQVLFYLADVSGHGVSAGVVSSLISSGVDIVVSEKSKMSDADLKDLTLSLHNLLYRKTDPDVFVTFAICIADDSGGLSIINCGHEKPILVSASGKVQYLAEAGLALGLVEDISKTLSVSKIKLKKDDKFYFYSDGVKEAWDIDDEKFGLQRFEKTLLKNTSKKLDLSKSIDDIRKFTGIRAFEDDVTIVGYEYVGR